MASVTFPAGLGGDGSTVTDDSNPTTGLGNGGHRTRFIPALSQMVVIASGGVTQTAANASTAATQAGNAASSAIAAANSAATAANAPGTQATSASSMAVGIGSKSITLNQTGKSFAVGQFVQIVRTASPTTDWVVGAITAFNSGTGAMTITATDYFGSATTTGWLIAPCSPVGLNAVTAAGTQTLTNKTLTLPVISSISNTGTVTLPTSTDTLVGRATTDTLTNKTMSGVVLDDGYTEGEGSVTGTTPALSPNNGSIQTWMLTGSSVPVAGTWASGQSITLMVDDGSSFTINWSSLAVTWKTNNAAAPSLNITGFTAIVLWKVGTTIYGARVGDS